MVLFGLISGRSTGRRLAAFSKSSLKICVTICPPPGVLPVLPCATLTLPPCCVASPSGPTLYRPAASTSVQPCSRSAARNCSKAAAGVTARSVTRLSWPLTRGSTTTLRPVMVAMRRAPAWMWAWERFGVAGPRARTLLVPVSIAVWADIWPLAQANNALTATVLMAEWRRGESRQVIGSTHGDDGACAAAPSDDVQEVGQRRCAFGAGTGLAGKAQALAHPVAAAAQLQGAVERAQGDGGHLAPLQHQPVAAHRAQRGQARGHGQRIEPGLAR